MDFLEHFPQRDRDRLLAAATTLKLGRGDLLIRRGEKGGDLFRVAEGEVEVVDSRTQPPVILEVIGKGGVVGEMAFLDERVRSADVRASDTAICQRWEKPSLQRILDNDPSFAAAFYKTLAELAVERARTVTSSAVSGGLRGAGGAKQVQGSAQAAAAGHALAGALAGTLVELEPTLRRDPARAKKEAMTALHVFHQGFVETLDRLGEEDAIAAGTAAARDLHPYIVRSHLGELSLDRLDGHSGDYHALMHLLGGVPAGDGSLGEIVDDWFLSMPTPKAFRERRAAAVEQVLEALPNDPPFRMVLLNASSGGLIAGAMNDLGRLGGDLIFVEGRRLAFMDGGVANRPRTVRVRIVHEDLVGICLGTSRFAPQPQHIVVIDGMLEYLPERLAASLMRVASSWLAPRGRLVMTGIGDAPDDPIFRFLLQWPMVRHNRATLERLLWNAGLENVLVQEASSAGLVLRGSLAAGLEKIRGVA